MFQRSLLLGGVDRLSSRTLRNVQFVTVNSREFIFRNLLRRRPARQIDGGRLMEMTGKALANTKSRPGSPKANRSAASCLPT
jgi:hypothetical protein